MNPKLLPKYYADYNLKQDSKYYEYENLELALGFILPLFPIIFLKKSDSENYEV